RSAAAVADPARPESRQGLHDLVEQRAGARLERGRRRALVRSAAPRAAALRGDKVVPVIAQLLGASTGNADADLGLSILTAWAAAGAHRRDLDGDGVYDHAAAVALMDRWWVPLTDAVFDTL